jgi:hypothetical protein
MLERLLLTVTGEARRVTDGVARAHGLRAEDTRAYDGGAGDEDDQRKGGTGQIATHISYTPEAAQLLVVLAEQPASGTGPLLEPAVQTVLSFWPSKRT